MRFLARKAVHFTRFQAGEEFALEVSRKPAPLCIGNQVSSLAGFLRGEIAGSCGGDRPAIDIRGGKNPGENPEPGNVRIFANGRMDGGEETGEPSGADTFERQFACARISEFRSGGGRRTG